MSPFRVPATLERFARRLWRQLAVAACLALAADVARAQLASNQTSPADHGGNHPADVPAGATPAAEWTR
jgi:hypothetical protein